MTKYKVWIHVEADDERDVDVEWAASYVTNSEDLAIKAAKSAHKYLVTGAWGADEEEEAN